MASITGSQVGPVYAQMNVMRMGASRMGAHSARVFVAIGGVQYATGRLTAAKSIDAGTLSITGVQGQTPNTCTFVARGFAPTVGQDVLITLGSLNNTTRIFAGQILNVTQTYVGAPANATFSVSAIDYTWLLQRRKVLKKYTNQSATAIAVDLIASFASGFTTVGVAAGLPVIDEITFTNADLPSALTQLATRALCVWHLDYNKDLTFGVAEDDHKITATLTSRQPWAAISVAMSPAASATIAADAISSGVASWSHTCTGSNGLLLVACYTLSGNTVSGITYNGVALTLVGTTFDVNAIYLSLYALVAPATGTHTIAVTGTVASSVAASYNGVKQTAFPDAKSANHDRSASVSSPVAMPGGDWLVLAGVASALPQAYASGVLRASDSANLFLVDTNAPIANPAPHDPVALTSTHPTLSAFQSTRDVSQYQDRVYCEGGGGKALAAVAVGETIIPVDPIIWYEVAGGGVVVSGPQRIPYTTVDQGGGGSLVGPGIGPSTGINLANQTGAGVETGIHSYAATFTVGANESLPGPTQSIAVGLVAAPLSGPFLATPTGGAGPDSGQHYYAVSFTTGAGETPPGPVTQVITSELAAPASAPTLRSTSGGAIDLGAHVWAVSFAPPSGGETVPGPLTDPLTIATGVQQVWVTNLPASPPGVSTRILYRTTAGGTVLKRVAVITDNAISDYLDAIADASLGADALTTSTAVLHVVGLANIPLGPATVTGRKIWRSVAGGAATALKLLATIADNTTTVYTDTTVDASLGAAAPTTNTATANQVALASIPIGSATVTGRKLYRTVAGGVQLKLLATLADNTTLVYSDSIADASLGANVPVTDTSGLAQPAGQVLAGAATIPVASPGAFPSTGWAVIGNGREVIRYTSIVGSTLAGIPASGVGAITATVSFNSTITAAPQLTVAAGAIVYAIRPGDPVNLLVQVDDLALQAQLAGIIGGDGIQEDYLQDGRLSHTEALARARAQLALRGTLETRLQYSVRDQHIRAGALATVVSGTDFYTGPITAADAAGGSTIRQFKIQSFTISDFTQGPTFFPTWRVSASSSRFSFEDLLRLARNTST